MPRDDRRHCRARLRGRHRPGPREEGSSRRGRRGSRRAHGRAPGLWQDDARALPALDPSAALRGGGKRDDAHPFRRRPAHRRHRAGAPSVSRAPSLHLHGRSRRGREAGASRGGLARAPWGAHARRDPRVRARDAAGASTAARGPRGPHRARRRRLRLPLRLPARGNGQPLPVRTSRRPGTRVHLHAPEDQLLPGEARRPPHGPHRRGRGRPASRVLEGDLGKRGHVIGGDGGAGVVGTRLQGLEDDIVEAIAFRSRGSA